MRRPAKANGRRFATELLDNSIELLAIAGLRERLSIRAGLPRDGLMPARLLRSMQKLASDSHIHTKFIMIMMLMMMMMMTLSKITNNAK